MARKGRKRRKPTVRYRTKGKIRWELRRWHLVTAFLLLALLGAGSAWVMYPFWELTAQFGSYPDRRPSRLYGAPFEVVVGDRLDVGALDEHLDATGYRSVEGDRLRPGEYRIAGSRIGIFRRSFPTIRGSASASPVALRMEGDVVRSLVVGERARERAVLEPVLLTSYYGPDRKERRPVRLAEMPEELILSVLAAEDARFFEHGGVSLAGILRAAWANLVTEGPLQGGSTLTQQLTKNLFLTHERTVQRKLREAVLAVLVDLRYDKREILEAYLNEIYLGGTESLNLMGVGAASWAYFGKTPERLTLSEAATLAGIIPAPARFSPLAHPEAAKHRRDLVLGRLEDLGWLDPDEIEAARGSPLGTRPGGLGWRRAPYFADHVRREAARRFGVPSLADAGFVLLSTLSLPDQEAAEEAVGWGIRSLEEGWEKGRSRPGPLQAALVSMDPARGGILAYVGGRDYRRSQFDRAGEARRQLGSAFKPVVFAAALREGVVTPASPVEDEPITLVSAGQRWSPKNYDRKFRGRVDVRTVVEKSLNVPTVRVAMATGVERVVETAKALGVRSDPDPLPSVALGALEVTPVEMATIYSVFASGGIRPPAHGLRGILDPGGEPISGTPLAEPERVLEPELAYLITDLLQGVLDRGTGAGARRMGLKDPLAGKTGTTNERRDSWFAGYSPNRVTAVWVGYDENVPTRLSGARAALPIWTRFTFAVRPDGGYPSFARPEGIVSALVDPLSGELATDRCPEVRRELFLVGSAPDELCHLHRGFFADPLEQPEGIRHRRDQDGEPGRFREWLRRVFGDDDRGTDRDGV